MLADRGQFTLDKTPLGNPSTNKVTTVEPLNLPIGRPSDSAAAAVTAFLDEVWPAQDAER